MRVLNSLRNWRLHVAKGNKKYAEVRGPDGKRFAAWRAGRRQRYAERFAVGESAEDRRIMRNVRRAA